MLLSTFDRIILIQVLPAQGNYRTLRILRELREALAFSEAENAALQFHEGDEGLVYWNSEADKPKEVEIGEVAFEEIARSLKALDARGMLRDDHVSLFERFCPEAAAQEVS